MKPFDKWLKDTEKYLFESVCEHNFSTESDFCRECGNSLIEIVENEQDPVINYG